MTHLADLKLRPEHRDFIDRFTAACEKDERIVAAFLGGSYAKGYADPFSDVDVCVLTTELSRAEFYGERESFLQTLGNLVFLEDFGAPNIAFFIFDDGTEGELYIGSESQPDQIQSGPFLPLIDKTGFLEHATFPPNDPDRAEQHKKLRQYITWFWHEMSHFTTALGRGHLWWARGQLEALRQICVNLARLRNNFMDPDVGEEPYFKIEKAMPAEPLAPLRETFVPLAEESMLKAVHVLIQYYREVAIPLAREHSIPYPASLEHVMLERLQRLDN